jgi:hypothetical protein
MKANRFPEKSTDDWRLIVIRKVTPSLEETEDTNDCAGEAQQQPSQRRQPLQSVCVCGVHKI